MATIREIAQRADVSPTTVSLVLNGRGSISTQTKRRVLEVADRIKYKARQPGRPSLEKTGREVHNIVVAYPQRVLRHGVASELTLAWLAAIRQELVQAGHHLSLLSGGDHVSHDEVFGRMLKNKEVDGVILIGVTPNDGYLEQCLQAQLPLVVMNRKPKNDEFSYVRMDNYGSGERVVAHLKSLGHTRIGVVACADPHEYADDLRDGVAASFKAHGIKPVCSEQLITDVIDEKLVRRVCEKVIKSGATGVYVMGDMLAVLCMDVWHEMGVSIPKDLSVVGYDDLGLASSTGLVPTSVGFDKEFMGSEAVRILLDLIKKRPRVYNQGLIVETQVVNHDTTGPASC